MIIRTWLCLNKNCLHENTVADLQHPPCPRCGGAHVKWMPKAFSIKSDRTKRADADVKQLQEVYGDKDYNSPRRGERMQPRVNPVPIKGKTMRYAPAGVQGWAADVPVDGSGQPVAYCAPTGVSAPLSVQRDQRQSASRRIGLGAKVEAAHRPPGGIPR